MGENGAGLRKRSLVVRGSTVLQGLHETDRNIDMYWQVVIQMMCSHLKFHMKNANKAIKTFYRGWAWSHQSGFKIL